MNRPSSSANSAVFVSCFKRHWSRWLGIGILAFLIILAASLFLAPRTFTSKLSLSVALPTEAAGGLASMAGLSASPTAKYIGVLRSRRFAEEVESRAHLQSIYKTPSEEDMVDMILMGLTVTDSTRDGLIYLSLSLPAPPSLPRPSYARIQEMKTAVATATGLYGTVLREYVASSDFDRDSLLLTGADERVKAARKEYDASVTYLADLVRSQSFTPASNITRNKSSSGDVGGPEVAATELEVLYGRRATLEADLQALEATAQAGNAFRRDQLNHIENLPTEDPLLPKARAEASAASSAFEALRLQFGPEHPRVILAQDRLKLAQHALEREISSIRQGYTTQSVEVRTKLSGLTTQFNTVLRQIAQAEHGARLGQTYYAEFERRRNEVTLRLEVLKSVSSQAANLSVQLVSATKRLNVIDTARPARSAYPGTSLLGLFSLFLSTILVTGWVLIEFALAVRGAAGAADPVSRAA